MKDQDIIYHVVTSSQWSSAGKEADYFAESYESEGFIHCCRKNQIDYVLNTYFDGVEGLLLLKIDTRLLQAKCLMEAANGQVFPHVYGGINREAIVEILKLQEAV